MAAKVGMQTMMARPFAAVFIDLELSDTPLASDKALAVTMPHMY